jgi:MFS family permease
MRDLFRRRDVRLLLAAQTCSVFGDWTLMLVFGIWGKALTGSNAVAGLMIFAMAAPGLLAPLGGVLVDRLPRRAVMVALDLASVPAVLCLWAVHDRGQLWLLFAVALWYGLSSIVFASAMSGLVQSMLPADLVGPANGALATIRQGLRLVGPLVGAGLFAAVGGAWVATLDAVTFVLSALALLAIRHLEPRRVRETVSFGAELAAGARHLAARLDLRWLTVATVLCALGFGLTEPLVFALVDDGLHRPATFLGVLVCVQGVGALLGGLASTALVRRVGEGRLLVAGLVLVAVGTAVETTPSLPVVLVGFALFGLGLPTLSVAALTMLQHRTPGRLMGRTATAYEVVSSVPYTAAIGLGAVLVGAVSYRSVFAVVAVLLLLAAGAAVAAVRATVSATPSTAPTLTASLQ